MKTTVYITHDIKHTRLAKGQSGYIDGYCRGADGKPYAVVVVDHAIDMVPIHAIKVTGVKITKDYI